jgi:RND superfamily putative drug exporter
MFDRLGRLVIPLRWAFIVFWIVGAALFGALGPSLSKVGSADETSFLPADAESLAARNLVETAFPGDSSASSALIVFSRPGGLTDADRTSIEGLRQWFVGPGHVQAVSGYVTAEASGQLASMLRSADGVVELAEVDFDTPSFVPVTNEAVDTIRAHLTASGVLPGGLSAQVTGQAGIGRDYSQAILDGTDRTTLVTIVLVVLVLLLIYRAPLAALVPLVTIGVAFLVSRGLLGFLAQGGWKLSSILDSFIVVLAFGVGTDYTIFLVSRFREELTRNSHADAVRVTVGRIGAVIAASAATVVVGLTSMLVARFGMIQTTGPALAIVIVTTLLAGLTLTPSLLAVSGRYLFWPLHEDTRTESDEGRGYWASLARRITDRPGLLSAIVLVLLAGPLLALPQLKQNFDALKELPAGAESRLGFATLSAHLPQGQLMPLNVLVQVPSGNLADAGSLTAMAALENKIASLPDVQSVRSIVDPSGDGQVSDLVRPAVELPATADQLRTQPSPDLNVQLGDASLQGLQSVESYVSGLAAAFPQLAGGAILNGARADLDALVSGLLASRDQADVAKQLAAIADQIRAAAASGGGGDAAAELARLGAYFDDLAAALPDVTSQPSYQSIRSALTALASNSSDAAAGLSLLSGVSQLQQWFEQRPTPFYFSPPSNPPSADATATMEAMAAARQRLPGELDQLGAAFTAQDLYAPPALLQAYESADGTVARLYVTSVTDPYDARSFQLVADIRSGVGPQVDAFGQGASLFVGGSTAEFADVQSTITSDFQRVALITILGILLVLVILLRAVVAPVYLVLTVLLSYGSSLSLSALVLQQGMGQAGLNYFIPLMVFVLLVALGSDYNIFLMSRVREESATRPLREGIRYASARTGTVITSAGLILAGTFAALLSSPLQLLFQVGLAVALGVLIDTFVVRSLLVPAITARIGDAAWWPFHRIAAGHGLEPVAVVIEPPE